MIAECGISYLHFSNADTDSLVGVASDLACCLPCSSGGPGSGRSQGVASSGGPGSGRSQGVASSGRPGSGRSQGVASSGGQGQADLRRSLHLGVRVRQISGGRFIWGRWSYVFLYQTKIWKYL